MNNYNHLFSEEKQEINWNNSKACRYHNGIDKSDPFNSRSILAVVYSYGLKCALKGMVQVKGQENHKTNVNN